jgi:type 1 glutamine amidotransferase
MRVLLKFLVYFLFASSACCQKKSPHIVFVFGDEEYRSEESMPMLAQILKRELGAKISLCYPLDEKGIINPNINNNIAGLESVQNADMMVLFCRWRELPPDQVKYITDFAESGKPMAGFRTSTHTFKYKTDTSMFYLNNEWPTKVFGQRWITHHGHFDDGQRTLTSVYPQKGAKQTPIMNGVKPFEAYSWLYHVDGGEQKINPDCVPFLEGKSLKSAHELDGKLDLFPIKQPVAWTKPYKTKSGKSARVFFTTLGHPYDFRIESMRKLAINGIYWALGKEKTIPKNGVNVEFVTPYEPNNSGFGERYKQGMRPLVID